MTTPSLPAAYAGLESGQCERLEVLTSTIYQLQASLQMLSDCIARAPDRVLTVSFIEMFLLSDLYERLNNKFGVTRH